ncbi:MAG: ZIP family metal transporter [Acidobacteria bacterium]|nr:MAG: ZIP family metal transporter [Acidobacteriota bacterium]REK02309.1 MAG: ZIP family metal transporter [Acidobacteriota bacterium]REK13888.1 MAG: ZIP family metal transporter [Acidobacteriota bacterium]REK41882.1 MAG: ZIP family metal transporter [Acidobacteriota bacterium]
MEIPLYQLVLFGIAVALANVIGGLILFPTGIHRKYKSLLKYLLALGAGFMLAVTFVEVLPKTIELWQGTYVNQAPLYAPLILFLGGYLLTQFFEHTIAPHFHLGEEVHADHLLPASSAYTAIGGLLIHAFFDGVSISAASQVDFRLGVLMFIAVFLHKFPEGFTIGSMVLAAGKGIREVTMSTALVGATTLAGVLGFYLIGSNLDSAVVYALPIAGGVTLYVAASDLIPEVNHHGGKNPLVSLSVFAGVALFFALHFLLHEAVGG